MVFLLAPYSCALEGLPPLFTYLLNPMAQFDLGPLSFRLYSGHNWTHAEVAFVTNRNGGMARRETAAHVGFKSEHLLDAVGKQNMADSFEDPDTGTLHFGKIVQTPTGVYTISAKEVYTRALYERACKQGLNQAEQATAQIDETQGKTQSKPKPQPKAKTRAAKAKQSAPATDEAATAIASL